MKTQRLGPDDPNYPTALHALLPKGRAPPPLFLRGRLPHGRAAALVGTRRATPQALAMTRSLSLALASRGYSLWSGGALGIDTAVHEAALEAAAPTVVVMAGGLDDPYPKRNAALFEQVLAAGGALVSLEADGSTRRRYQFLRRNGVLAALTQWLIVVQAPLKSGARSAAAHARRLGRPVYAVPHPPWDKTGAGCSAEFECGAVPIHSAGHLLRLVTPGARADLPEKPPAEAVKPRFKSRSKPRSKPRKDRCAQRNADPAKALKSPESEALLAAMVDGPNHLDELCERSGMSLGVVSNTILNLTLIGAVVEVMPGHFQPIASP